MSCDSEFVVILDSAGSGPVRVEVRVQGRDPVYVAECPAGREGGCALDYRFPAFTPEFAAVRVVTPAGTRDTTIERVAYQTTQPNGAHCEPTCRQAFIRMTAPREQ